MPPFRPLQSRATTSYCWATRLISLVAHWATVGYHLPIKFGKPCYKANLYIDPAMNMNIIGPCTNVLDLGVSMSTDCTLDFHISNLYKLCSNLAGWILRTFTMRHHQVMLTLYKSLVMSRLEYASQLWSPYLKCPESFHQTYLMNVLSSYSKRLEVLKLYSLQRRREKYGIIYVWKIIEGLVPNLSDPIVTLIVTLILVNSYPYEY